MKNIVLLLIMVGTLNPTYADIFEAIENGDLKAVQACIANGVDVNVQHEWGDTALIWASNGQLAIVKYLVEKGADTSKMTIVEWAGSGCLEKVQECIKSGTDINTKDKYDGTALQNASYNGHLEIVKYLVENGADVNAIGWLDQTALIYASKEEHVEIIDYLVKNRANIDATNEDGVTALAWALEQGRTNVVKMLRDAGATE